MAKVLLKKIYRCDPYKNDYIHSLISEGILWYLRTGCLSTIDIPSSEPPFTHTVESIFDNVNFEYTIELHDGD